ncbi:hypothetical protein MXB_5060 [Myxobolus squamalis]|nr:hypothetical protein MXB_5060 [Myxobolus squamalis]
MSICGLVYEIIVCTFLINYLTSFGAIFLNKKVIALFKTNFQNLMISFLECHADSTLIGKHVGDLKIDFLNIILHGKDILYSGYIISIKDINFIFNEDPVYMIPYYLNFYNSFLTIIDGFDKSECSTKKYNCSFISSRYSKDFYSLNVFGIHLFSKINILFKIIPIISLQYNCTHFESYLSLAKLSSYFFNMYSESQFHTEIPFPPILLRLFFSFDETYKLNLDFNIILENMICFINPLGFNHLLYVKTEILTQLTELSAFVYNTWTSFPKTDETFNEPSPKIKLSLKLHYHQANFDENPKRKNNFNLLCDAINPSCYFQSGTTKEIVLLYLYVKSLQVIVFQIADDMFKNNNFVELYDAFFKYLTKLFR